MARKYQLSDFGCDRDTLNVNIDVVGETLRHPESGSSDALEVARNPQDGELESNDSSLDVDRDISSSFEKIQIDDGGITQEETATLISWRGSDLPSAATTCEACAMS